MGAEPSNIGNWDKLYREKIQFIKDEQLRAKRAIDDASIEWGDKVRDIPSFSLLPHELWQTFFFQTPLMSSTIATNCQTTHNG